MSRIRVLHTTSSLAVGGVGRLLLRNLSYFSEDFENFVGYLTPRDDLRGEFQERGADPVCFGHDQKTAGLRTIARIRRFVKTHDIDLIHVNHPLDRVYATIAGNLTRVPVVATLHNTSPPASSGTLRSRSFAVERVLAHGIAHYVAVSESVMLAQSRTRRIDRKRITVVRTGIELESFRSKMTEAEAADLRAQVGADENQPVLINVGRLHPQKGQQYLIPMVASLVTRFPNLRMLIVGEGAERPKLERLIAQSGLAGHISLLGRRSDIPDLLTISDVFVFPSIFGEGFPVAVLEASAAGIPIVATELDPLVEITAGGSTARLVTLKDGEALAEAIAELLGDREAARNLGKAAQAVARERFGVESSVRALESVYRHVLS